MKSVSTMFRAVDDMHEMLKEPKWIIGFKYFMLADKESIDLDIGALMQQFGYTEEYELCNSYYLKYPMSIGMPMSDGIDNFFQHLKDIGIFKEDTPVGALEQTDNCREVYEQLLPTTT